MRWQTLARQFSFQTESGLREFVNGLLFTVIDRFEGKFLGHAKCIIKSEGKTYFASTTAMPPVVEWQPLPDDSNAVKGTVEAVWIFVTDHIPEHKLEGLEATLEHYLMNYK